MNNKTRNLLAGGLAVVLIGGGGWYYYGHRASAATVSYVTASVKKGSVMKVVTATGTVQNPSVANLSFGQAGKLSKLSVNVGDKVKKGQTLAQLDTASLQNQVKTAQANLQIQQAKLQALMNPATSADLASLQASVDKAQTDLATAQANLQTAKQNADTGYLQGQISQAANTVTTAQANYDAISKSGDTTQIAFAKAQLDNANKNYSTALSNLSNLPQLQQAVTTAQNAVTAAQSTYNVAVIQLNQKKQPPQDTDIQQAQASITQAQVTLQNAQLDLQQGTLIAPFDGVVTATTGHEGEQVGSTAAVVSLLSSQNGLQITVPIDDSDIPSVKLGQTADITVDSIPGLKITGKVLIIAPTGQTQNNVTTFPVTVQLDANDSNASNLIPGMSANVSIEIEKKDNVLVVPDAAVRGNGNAKGVMVPASDKSKTQFIRFKAGIDDGTNTEVLSGLDEGQAIIIGTRGGSGSGGSSQGSGNNRGGSGIGGIGGFGGGSGRGSSFSGGGGGRGN